jgi:hypothetical protein
LKMTTDTFDVREWNRKVKLLCAAEEIGDIDKVEYTANLLIAAGIARLTEEKLPSHFGANRMIRKRLSKWIEQFAQYQDFADGCWLLMRYYDTNNVIKTGTDADLVELHRRWSSLVNLSLYYGNAYQIENFVPFANAFVSDIVGEMLRRKKKVVNKAEHLRPANWRLDIKQVKDVVDYEQIYRAYFPEMVEVGKNKFKAFCKWHYDAPTGNPNLSINTENGLCYCHRCNEGFDAFGMIMSLDKTNFATAINTAWSLGHP